MQDKIRRSVFTILLIITSLVSVSAQAQQLSATQLLEAGRKQQTEKKYDAAIKSFTECLNLDSSQSECYRERGTANLSKSDFKTAIADFTKAIRINPGDKEAYRARAFAFYSGKSFEAAIADLTKVIEISPTDASGLSDRGSVYHANEDYQKAIADFSKAIELSPKNAEYYFNRGTSFGKINQGEQAIKDFSRAIEINAKYADAYAIRGAIYFGAGKTDLALADLKQARMLEPRSDEVRAALQSVADSYLEKAKVEINDGELDSALANCAKAVEINSESAPGYSCRSQVYLMIGDKEKDPDYYNLALKDASKAIELEAHPTLLTNRSELYEKIGNAALAIADLTGAIAVYSQSKDSYDDIDIAAIYEARARLTADKPNYDAAIADYSKVIELTADKDKLPELYYRRGLLYQKKSASDLMLADFRTALQKNAGDLSEEIRKDITEKTAAAETGKPNQTAEDYIRSASGYMSGKEISVEQATIAVDLLTKAIALKTDSAELYKLRGNANHEKGESASAQADFSSAIKLNPKDSEAYKLRAKSYTGIRQGDANDLRKINDWTTALALAPNDTEILQSRGNYLYMKAINAKSLAYAKEADKDYESIIRIKPDEKSHLLRIQMRYGFKNLVAGDRMSISNCEISNWAREAVQQTYKLYQTQNSAFTNSLKAQLDKQNPCDFSQISAERTRWYFESASKYCTIVFSNFGDEDSSFKCYPKKAGGEVNFDRYFFEIFGKLKSDKNQRNKFYIFFSEGLATDGSRGELVNKETWTYEIWGDELRGSDGNSQKFVAKRR